MLDFYVGIFGDRSSATFAVPTAEKHAQIICGEFGEAIRQKKLCFSLLFSLCWYSLFSGHPILRPMFYLQIENIARNPFCKKIPQDMLENGVSHIMCCVKLSTRGGIAPFRGVLTSLKKHHARWGIASIVSHDCAIWGHQACGMHLLKAYCGLPFLTMLQST